MEASLLDVMYDVRKYSRVLELSVKVSINP